MKNKLGRIILTLIVVLSLVLSGCSGKDKIIKEDVYGAIPRLHKEGILIKSDKESQENKFTGDGKFMYLDGKTYEGNFANGLKDGAGKVTLEDGKIIYEGNWKQNSVSGNGKLYYEDGSYFQGAFKDSKPWSGKYIVKNGEVETTSEIKEGRFAVVDLSNDEHIKSDIQSTLNGAFEKFGIPTENPLTDRTIIEEFAFNLIFSDEKEKYENYEEKEKHENYEDSTYYWTVVPEGAIDEYTNKYFDRKLNHNLYKTQKIKGINVEWSYYYNDKNYYVGAPGWGIDPNIQELNNVYKVNHNTLLGIVSIYIEEMMEEELSYAYTALVELEEKDDRYIIKGAREVRNGYTVTQGYELNQNKALVNENNDIADLFLDESKKVLVLNNIKKAYGQMNEKDKTNDKVLDIISNDVDAHIENLFSNTINIDSRQINIKSNYLSNHLDIINKYKDEINQYSKELYNAFKEVGINLKREPSRTIVINLENYPNKDDFSFYIGSDIKQYLSHIDKAIFNISGLKITFDTKTLSEELAKGDLLVAINNNNGVYSVAFKDANGAIKDNVESKVSLSLPVEGSYKNKSVYYTSDKNSIQDNVGGQYDIDTKTLEIETKATGKFEIKENINKTFNDIEKQDEETKKSIENLVSKGIMEGKSKEEFKPDEVMTREEFAMSMVKTFYELDRNAKTSFTDVVESDKYYPYISSSEKENIVKGYDDKTFKGKDPITKEDVISICSRALHEKKKYIYPDNPEQMLKFRDKTEISNYAKKEVALAVQEGLLNSVKGKFKPRSTMTRAEVAVIINRLIEKLY